MFKTLTPRQKQVAVALAGAAVLAVIALLSRRRGEPAQQEAAADATGGTPPFGSTFADNGEAASGLSSAITGGLGEVALGLESVGASQGALTEQLASQQGMLDQLAAQRAVDSAAIEQALGRLTLEQPARDAPAATAQAATARTTRPKPAGVFTQTRGERAGRDYKLVVQRGKNVRLYESKPGKRDFGKRPGTRIVAGPNSKAVKAAAAKSQGAAKKKKASAQSPSRRTNHPQPPRKGKRR